MKCPRCKNEDKRLFGTNDGRIYCRRCIQFGRVYVDEPLKQTPGIEYTQNAYYHLDYKLTKDQQRISNCLVQRYKQGFDSKVKAVCGAGKTEIVYAVIKYVLSLGKRVCFTTPRSELTKELYQRIVEQFHDVTIDLVCGGHTDRLEGQLIICTTHQLYRFYKGFELLIIDEVDAFPYDGNDLLKELLSNAIASSRITLSATMDDKDALLLTKRYHGHLLDIPKFVRCPAMIAYLDSCRRIYQYKHQLKPVFVYASSKQKCQQIASFYQRWGLKVVIIHSKIMDIQERLEKVKNGHYDVVVCTTILERGVTMKNVQVIVLDVEHPLFDTPTLIQIAGRVGRKQDYPTGAIWFYGVYQTKAVKQCIKSIKNDNAYVA